MDLQLVIELWTFVFVYKVDLRLFGVFDFEFFEIDSCIASHAN
jgi:hypothetical protein